MGVVVYSVIFYLLLLFSSHSVAKYQINAIIYSRRCVSHMQSHLPNNKVQTKTEFLETYRKCTQIVLKIFSLFICPEENITDHRLYFNILL